MDKNGAKCNMRFGRKTKIYLVLSCVSRSDSNFSTLLNRMEEDLNVGAIPAILEVQRSGTIRDSPMHELVQINPSQRDSVQLSGATPVALPRFVRDSESDRSHSGTPRSV